MSIDLRKPFTYAPTRLAMPAYTPEERAKVIDVSLYELAPIRFTIIFHPELAWKGTDIIRIPTAYPPKVLVRITPYPDVPIHYNVPEARLVLIDKEIAQIVYRVSLALLADTIPSELGKAGDYFSRMVTKELEVFVNKLRLYLESKNDSYVKAREEWLSSRPAYARR